MDETDRSVHTKPVEKPVFDAAALFSGMEDSAVKIKVAGSHFGSGFYVTSDEPHSCEIGTLTHVTNGEAKISVTTADGQTVDADLELADWKHEIAIYQLRNVRDPRRVCQDAPVSDRIPDDREQLIGAGIAPGSSGGAAPIVRPFVTEAIGFASRDKFNLPNLPGEDMSRDVLVLHGVEGPVSTQGQHGYSGAQLRDASGLILAIEAGAADGNLIAEFGTHLKKDLEIVRAKRKAQEKHD